MGAGKEPQEGRPLATEYVEAFAERGRRVRQAGAVLGSAAKKARTQGAGLVAGVGTRDDAGGRPGIAPRQETGEVFPQGREREFQCGDEDAGQSSWRKTTPADTEAGRKKQKWWKPDTGTQHISPMNALEVAGERLLDRMPRQEQADWGAFGDAAEDLCPNLGISPQAWHVVVAVMGCRAASICVMIIDRRTAPGAEDPVRHPDAYLRGMINRSRDDDLHLHATVFEWARGMAA